jgi:hypothetical protein
MQQFEHLESHKINQYLQIYKLPRLAQDEMYKLNSTGTINEIEFIV